MATVAEGVAGMPRSLHDLRQTAVALWIAAGAGPKEVAIRAGHTSVSFTLDRYGHLYPEADRALRGRLDRFRAAGDAEFSRDVDHGQRERRRRLDGRDALTCWVGGWACQDLNLGSHPYQRWTAKRHASQPFRWSCDTISPTRMG
jgi:hypothetical protein